MASSGMARCPRSRSTKTVSAKSKSMSRPSSAKCADLDAAFFGNATEKKKHEHHQNDSIRWALSRLARATVRSSISQNYDLSSSLARWYVFLLIESPAKERSDRTKAQMATSLFWHAMKAGQRIGETVGRIRACTNVAVRKHVILAARLHVLQAHIRRFGLSPKSGKQ